MSDATSHPPTAERARFSGMVRVRPDAKSRVILPVVFRRSLPATPAPVPVAEEGKRSKSECGTLVLMAGPEGYIQALTEPEWQERIAQIMAKTKATGAELRALRRKTLGSVVQCPLDEKGRFVLPQRLAEGAGIDGDVLIVGVDRAMEIWNPDRYFELDAKTEVDTTDLEDILF